jgi:ribosomal-protein-alanine acetyltransferase
MTRKKKASAFVVIWEFRVRPSKRRAFEKIYGPDGDWAKFFRRNKEYIRTDLIRDRQSPLRYLTLDFWTSPNAYQRFKKENQTEYAAIDKQCAVMTTKERLLGEFGTVGDLASVTPPTNLAPKAANPRPASQVRVASIKDIPAIVELERESASAAHWPETTYRRVFEQKSPACIALVIEGESGGAQANLCGFLIARVSGEDCELENVVVRRHSQSQGLGWELVRALADAAREQHATRIFLEVRESNAAARGLYEKCGFTITGRRKSYYNHPAEDAVLYTLQL